MCRGSGVRSGADLRISAPDPITLKAKICKARLVVFGNAPFFPSAMKSSVNIALEKSVAYPNHFGTVFIELAKRRLVVCDGVPLSLPRRKPAIAGQNRVLNATSGRSLAPLSIAVYTSLAQFNRSGSQIESSCVYTNSTFLVLWIRQVGVCDRKTMATMVASSQFRRFFRSSTD